VKSRLKGAPTAQDVARLASIHRELQALMVGMNPGAPCHAPLFAAIATVQACGAEWSGNPAIWREIHSIQAGGAYKS
jgi:hypothetical protein